MTGHVLAPHDSTAPVRWNGVRARMKSGGLVRRVGAVSFWSGQLLSASGQPRVPRPTVRRPCGSLPGSTGLISSAPLRWAQLPRLSGNGGCRHSSAVQLSWRAATLQLFATAAAAHLYSPQLLAPAGSLSSHLLPLRWAPGSPALLNLTYSAEPPAKPLSPPLASVVGKGPL